MILADSHVHLDFPDFGQDLAQVLHRARAGGVDYFNVIGTRLKQVAELNQLKQEIAGSITSLGIHPHHAAEEPTSESYIQQAVEACQAHAVGETGLDFHYDFSPRPIQEEVFRYHLRVAQRLNLPVVIHTREAEERTRMIVEEEGLPAAGGVLHCFTGSESMAQWAMEQGLHISFSGVLTFRTGEDLRRIAANLPLERILLETDAPYLAPIPHRGKRNEPSFLVHTAKTLAQVRQISLDQVANTTTDNFLRLFRVAGNSMTGDKGTLAYAIGDALYLNISRGCTQRCSFCPKWQAPKVHHFDLSLTANPTAAELIQAIEEPNRWREIVFCGFGEPTLRLSTLLEVTDWLKGQGVKRLRLNTDGLANLVYGRDITPSLAGRIDALSISLNAQDEATYKKHCRPSLDGAWQGMLDFVQAARAHVPEVVVTAIDGLPGVNMDQCQALANQLGVVFRARKLDRVG